MQQAHDILSKFPFALLFLALVGGTLVLTGLSALFFRHSHGRDEGYRFGSRFFLVLLRIAIGWHIFFEGMEKLNSPTWSSEAYLRESMGPLSPHFRKLAGDRLVAKLDVGEAKIFPEALDRDWTSYLDAFKNHYALDEKQATAADLKVSQARTNEMAWLQAKEEVVTIPGPYPPELKVSMTMPQRIAKLQELQAKVDEFETLMPTTKADVLAKFKSAKADVNKFRSEMKKSLDAKTAEIKKSLTDLLTAEQKATPMPEPVVIPRRYWGILEYSDAMVKFGLLALGGCLMAGLFSRLSAGLAGLLILSFYLAMPPLPGYPEVPRAEGTYLIINKTLIESIALFALACIPTGRWAGVDSLLWFFWPWNWNKNGESAMVEAGK